VILERAYLGRCNVRTSTAPRVSLAVVALDLSLYARNERVFLSLRPGRQINPLARLRGFFCGVQNFVYDHVDIQ
jgi:hypothetical protein